MKRLTLALIATLELAAVFVTGCASVPKPHALTPKVMTIIRITECDKPFAYIIVTSDGAVHAAPREELSKDEVDGIDTAAEALPDGNAGDIPIPCVPTQTTSF